MSEDTTEYELERLISHRRSWIIEANACDYKTTSRVELDRDEAGVRAGRARGRDLESSMSPEDRGRCRRLAANLRGTHSALDDLTEHSVGGVRCVIPRWLTYHAQYGAIKAIFVGGDDDGGG